MREYCVYVHSAADSGQPFYVGKSKGRRWKTTHGRSRHWHDYVNKHGFETRKIIDNLPEACAFSLERALIYAHGKDVLVNKTTGGQGASGRVKSAEEIAKMSAIHKGKRLADCTIRAAIEKNSKPIGTRCGLRFPSMAEAIRQLGFENPLAAKASISYCAKGRMQNSYGYEWGYIIDGEPQFLYENRMSDPRPKRWKAVKCSNGMKFDGMHFATAWLKTMGWGKAVVCAISRAANTGGMAYGYRWEYV